MKNILRMILPAILLMTLLSGSAFAQTKIATVDLRKVFDNYWKTKQATASIQAEAMRLDRDDKDYKDKFKQDSDAYQKLLGQANDSALSITERDKKKLDADAKLKQLQESKAMIDQFERQAQIRLSQKKMDMVQKILAEIRVAVAARAKSGGYALVADTSSKSITLSGVSVDIPSDVIYSNGNDDMTDALLAQLNVGAPIDVSTPAKLPSTPSLLSTNLP
jgi:outer membrane protein